MENEFVFTPELVSEYARQYKWSSGRISVQDFIKEKLKELSKEKDYEILNCITPPDIIHAYVEGTCLGANKNVKQCVIHSVRRLSDNQIFSIGDAVDGYSKASKKHVNGKIEHFCIAIHDLKSLITYVNGSQILLEFLNKSKERDYQVVDGGSIGGKETIITVKRISDGEVFTIGDKVLWYPQMNCDRTTITEFRVVNNELNVYGEGFGIDLSLLEKIKKRIPLFTTEQENRIVRIVADMVNMNKKINK